jgi:hypothetical protein
MRDRAAKRREAQPKEDTKDFADITGRRRSGFRGRGKGTSARHRPAEFLNARIGASPPDT